MDKAVTRESIKRVYAMRSAAHMCHAAADIAHMFCTHEMTTSSMDGPRTLHVYSPRNMITRGSIY